MLVYFFVKYMLPVLVHLKSQEAYQKKLGTCVLILTPYQPPKEDIYAATKTYIDAAEAKCCCIYETDEKSEQIEKLKSRNKNFF